MLFRSEKEAPPELTPLPEGQRVPDRPPVTAQKPLASNTVTDSTSMKSETANVATAVSVLSYKVPAFIPVH